MCASGNCSAAHARAARCGRRQARVAVPRALAGAPKQSGATCTPDRAAAHPAVAATNRPNGRRRHAPFDFDRLCA
ncbi:hypothetical protein B7G54_27310 [Burkholderia puraquae]|uniref:Uncharacterized protein n=1 Tax=Burkholderia puraquae TaxID=1904757 RepID=A0A1X1PB66_9BURK|nr:hypothetical protein B7G54_27310 [Burkholderia puraquae]